MLDNKVSSEKNEGLLVLLPAIKFLQFFVYEYILFYLRRLFKNWIKKIIQDISFISKYYVLFLHAKNKQFKALNPKIYLFFFFSLISFFSFSQDVNSSRFLRNIGISANIIKGYDFSARGRNAPNRNFDAIGAEFDFIYRADGHKDWQK
jgi:hypothetical protein